MRRSALLAGLLLLPACGDDGVTVERTSALEQPTPAPTPTAVPTQAPSRAPVVSTPPPTSPRPTSAPAATKPPLRTAAQGDVDGDGTPDQIRYEGREVVVTLSGSGRQARASTDADLEGGEPATAGVEDLDRDGRAEVFVRVGSGASTTFLLPLRYDGRSLAPLRVTDAPFLLGIGGSATHGDGFSCTEQGTLVVRSASSDDDGTSFTVTSTTYRVDGHRLVQVARSAAQARGMDDPRVGEAYLVDCRSVGEGG